MNLDAKQDKIMDAISNLDWSDSNISEIMEGFFNSPLDAIEQSQGEMSEDHIQSLFDLLNLSEDDEDE